ncbi:MAG TPA: TrkA family potassium uptake protein [Anaerolineales bacterium]|jgi:trk system potassium uptake protein TrkA|nr:TrkA family potassium uptake protein [Anaerolineales bacterium]
MFVIIVGGGKTGSQLAAQLLAEGHQVRVIEDRPQVLERLKQEMPEEAVVSGDGSSPAVLETAGIEHADVLAAVTGDDEANLVITNLARFEFKIPRTIARVNNPKNAWLFDKQMGVDVALSQADILAKLIAEEMSLGDMMTLLKLRRGEYSIVEEKVHPKAVVVGKSLRDITLPPECVFVAILRKNQLIVPHGETTLQPVDEVIALVHTSHLADLAALLGRPAPVGG